jgi:hypothetical protein
MELILLTAGSAMVAILGIWWYFERKDSREKGSKPK